MGIERRRRRLRRSTSSSEPAAEQDTTPTGEQSGQPAGATAPADDHDTAPTDEQGGQPAGGTAPADEAPRAPSPQDLAELGGTFAMTAAVQDPDQPGAAESNGLQRAGGADPAQAGNRDGWRVESSSYPSGAVAGDLAERPGHERTGNERPANERPGHERPGNERPGNERPGYERPGYEAPADDLTVPERDDPQTERGLRGLVGGGSSQVGVGAAMRARDAARPTEEDLARADVDLVIIRRGWVPREDLPPRSPRR